MRSRRNSGRIGGQTELSDPKIILIILLEKYQHQAVQRQVFEETGEETGEEETVLRDPAGEGEEGEEETVVRVSDGEGGEVGEVEVGEDRGAHTHSTLGEEASEGLGGGEERSKEGFGCGSILMSKEEEWWSVIG